MDRYGDAFALGVKLMDDEHHRLAVLLQEFVVCMKEEGPLERAHGIVQQALTQANAHFAHEEELMARHRYPGLAEEKLHHRMLRLQLTTLIGDALNTGVCDQVTLDNLSTIQQVLYDHIAGPDRELAEFLIARGVA